MPQNGPASASAEPADPVDDLVVADERVARSARWFTRPVRRFVNAPHLLVVVIVAVWVICSMLYAVIEDKGPVESLWWGVVTGSTVGYGDFYPSSTAGRGVATILIMTMIVLLPIAVGHVIANLVLDRNQFSHDEQVALASALESAHERIDRIEHLLVASMIEQHGADFVRQQLDQHAANDAGSVDSAEEMLRLFSRSEG